MVKIYDGNKLVLDKRHDFISCYRNYKQAYLDLGICLGLYNDEICDRKTFENKLNFLCEIQSIAEEHADIEITSGDKLSDYTMLLSHITNLELDRGDSLD